MKTQLRICSLRGLATCAVVAALLNGVYAQPEYGTNKLSNNPKSNLETYIYNADQLLKYKAPEKIELEIYDPETQKNLDLFVENTETVLKYKAPEFSEYEEICDIEPFIETALNDLRYRAPEEDNSRIDIKSKNSAINYAHADFQPVRVEFYKGPDVKPTYVNFNENSLKTLHQSRIKKISLIKPVNKYSNK